MWQLTGKIPKLDLVINEEAPGTSAKQAIARLRLRLGERYRNHVIPSVKNLQKCLTATDTGKLLRPKSRSFPKPLENPWWNR